MYLGIDVGGTKIRGAYFQQKEVVLTPRLATPAGYGEFLELLAGLVAEASRAGEPIRRLAVGVPGTCTERRATWVPNLPYLSGRDLADDLRGRLGISVMLANDAQLALLGEIWRGVARDRQSAALMSVGTGVGGALMLGGKIVRGAHGSAGAFGWLNLDYRQAPDPEHGYLELRASGSALEELGRQLAPPRSSYELVAKAREGAPAEARMVAETGALLGMAFASIASLFDPEILIFAGGLATAFDLFAPVLREQLRRYGSPSVRETPVLAAQLGADAAAYGALRAAMLLQSMWA